MTPETSASGEDGLALARRLGADIAMDGRHGDIAAAARRFAPDGVDAAGVRELSVVEGPAAPSM
jgi:hypothetical protein